MSKRVPLSVKMTLGEAAELALREFLSQGIDEAVFEVGLEVGEGRKKRLLAVRFRIDVREIGSIEELLPATPRH